MAIRCKHPRKTLRERQLGRIIPALVMAVVAVAVVSGQQPSQKAGAVPADRFVTVQGLRLHYLDWGNAGAPPFVMVHGIDRIAHTFDHVAPHFASRYHVIAIDMRGHGDSGWDPAGRYTVEDHVGDLAGLVRELGLKQLTLWGNSTGGRVS